MILILRNLFFIMLISFALKTTAQNRTKVNFGLNWEFKRVEKNSNFEQITVPHTAKIENLIVKKQFQGICWYQKKFKLSKIKDKKIVLYFEGVMQEADIWVNNKKVSTHQGGFLPFSVDITSYVSDKNENSIKVKVNNQDNPSYLPGKPLQDLDFNYYGGIYRNVYLITTNKLYITNAIEANKKASGGIYVNFNAVDKKKAEGTIQVHLKNEFVSKKEVLLKFILTNRKGEKLEFKAKKIVINANSDKSITQKIEVNNPDLWSIYNPHLYNLELQVISNNRIIDNYSEKIGIRKSEIKDDGYYLNDKKLFISGTNQHQEYPYLGYAISDEAQFRDAVKIKNAGFDFVRMSHYPHSESFLNACDELGILVMNSLTGWQFFGDETFQKNAIKDIREMARRDRNHPSIIFWEASLNETNMSERFMKEASKTIKEELPFANNYSACWLDNENYDLFIPARQHAQAPDYWTKYNKKNRKIFIAEYGDWEYYAQNAGFNQTEFANLKEDERTSRQLRGSGEKRLLQQAFNFQEAANSNRKGSETIGDANWVMFDYNRGYSPDLESSGISDIFRLPKFVYSFYQSQRDANIVLDKKLISGPIVNIANYWNSNSTLNVTVFSNCEEVALFLNDSLVAKQKPIINENNDKLNHPPFVFKLNKFIPGALKAEGFIADKKVAVAINKTPKNPTKIELTYDLSSTPINPDFPDMVFVYAKIVDENGTIVPSANNEISFAVSGQNATLIGQNPIVPEAGIATIILKTIDFKKTITVTAKGTDLQNGTLQIEPTIKKVK